MFISLFQKLLQKGIRKRLRRLYWQKFYRGRSSAERHLQLPFGQIKVRMGEAVGGNIFSDGIHEKEETLFIQDVVEADWICLDIGANIGYFSVLLGKICSSGKVIAIEPIEENATLVHYNLKLNDLNICLIENSAIGKTSGQQAFTVSNDSAFSGFKNTGKKGKNQEILVDTVAPIDLIEKYQLTKIDFVKIDVEGAEHLIFEAFEPIFEIMKPRYILSECNESNLRTYGYEIEEYIALMQRYGYEVFVITEHGKLTAASEELLTLHDNIVFKSKD